LATFIDLGATQRWQVCLCEFSNPTSKEAVKNYRPSPALIYCDIIPTTFVSKSLVRCLRTSFYHTFLDIALWFRFSVHLWRNGPFSRFWDNESFRNASPIACQQNTFNDYPTFQARNSMVII